MSLSLPRNTWQPALSLLLAIIIATIWATPALADERLKQIAQVSVPQALDPLDIVGSGDNAAGTGDVVESEYTGSRLTIDRNQLEQPGADLGEVLANSAGLQQLQSGGFGTFSTLTVRAASAAQTDVYLDGILLNTSADSLIDLSTLEILNFGSVDIYKGSTPLQLGYAGIGGAVNLNTDRNDTASDTQLRLGIGRFSYLSLSAATRGKSDKWDWTASLSERQSDNDFTFVNDKRTTSNTADDERQRRINNEIHRTAALLKGGYQWNKDQKTDVLIQVSKRDAGVPGVQNLASDNANLETFRSQIHLSQRSDNWQGWNTRHSLYWHQSDSLFNDPAANVDMLAQRLDTEVDTLGVKTYWEKILDTGTVGVSAELRDVTLDQFDGIITTDKITVSEKQLLLSAHWALLASDDQWLVTPGIRWQSNRREGILNSISATDEVIDFTESEFGLQLGAAYWLRPDIRLSFNAGNYFRTPSFSELYGSTGLISGNPNLIPEQGTNLELSLQGEWENLSVQASVFQSQRDELIITSFNALGLGAPSNTGKAEITGLEFSLTWQARKHWTVVANTTIQEPRNKASFAAFNNKLLPGQARLSTFARLSYKPGSLGWWYEWQATRDRFYDSANLLPADNTSTHSIGVEFRQKPWQLGARITNITGDTVEDFNGFPKPGRSVFFSVTHLL